MGILPEDFDITNEHNSFSMDNANTCLVVNKDIHSFSQVKSLVELDTYVEDPDQANNEEFDLLNYLIIDHNGTFSAGFGIVAGVLSILSAFFYSLAALFDVDPMFHKQSHFY